MYTHNKPLHLSPYDHPDIYPGPSPSSSFLYYKDQAYPLSGVQPLEKLQLNYNSKKQPLDAFLEQLGAAPLSDRYPMLSYGSNVCLAQLKYKFHLNPQISDLTIHIRGRIWDTDVIYASYIAKYGALPATLGPMKGARCQVWLSFLDEKQFRLITQTESVYSIARHQAKKLVLDNGLTPSEFYAYFYPDAFTFGRGFFRFPDIPATNTRAQAVWEAHMLQQISNLLGMDRDFFIKEVRNKTGFRKQVQEFLRLFSVPITHPDWELAKKIKKWKEI